MKRKRYKKYLMARGIGRNMAEFGLGMSRPKYVVAINSNGRPPMIFGKREIFLFGLPGRVREQK